MCDLCDFSGQWVCDGCGAVILFSDGEVCWNCGEREPERVRDLKLVRAAGSN